MNNELLQFHILGGNIKRDIVVKKLARKNTIFGFVKLLFFKYHCYLDFVSIIMFLKDLAFIIYIVI